MDSTLDRVLARTGRIDIQRRIKRFDVDWGVPHYALHYRRYVHSLQPDYHWTMHEDATSVSNNVGTLGNSYNLTHTGTVTFEDGEVNRFDQCAVYGGGYSYAPNRVDAEMETGYSVIAWFYLEEADAPSGGNIRAVVSHSSGPYSSSAKASFTIAVKEVTIGGQAYVKPVVYFGGQNIGAGSTDTPRAIRFGAWNMVVLTVEDIGDGTYKPTLYLNGEVLESRSPSSKFAPNYTDSVRILVGALEGNNGNIPSNARFPGKIDEVSVIFNTLSPAVVDSLYSLGGSVAWFQPNDSLESEGFVENLKAVPWTELLESQDPLHWWKFDALTDTDKYVDYGVRGAAGTVFDVVLTADAGKSSPINSLNGGTPLAHKFDADNNASGTAYGISFDVDLENGIPTDDETLYTPASISFFSSINWLHQNGDLNVFMGLSGVSPVPGDTIPYEPRFYICGWEDGKLIVLYKTTATAVSGQNTTYRPWRGTVVCDNFWKLSNDTNVTTGISAGGKMFHLYTITVSGDGVVSGYRDGVLIGSAVLQDGMRGIMRFYGGADGSLGKFRIGGNFSNEVGAPTTIAGLGSAIHRVYGGNHFIVDEPQLYARLVRLSEMQEQYKVAKLGPYYKSTKYGFGTLSDGVPYAPTTSTVPELSNEQDITEYVESYSVERDIKQMVETASLQVKEEWGVTVLSSLLKVNTYITIEERYVNDDEGYDSGWVSIGHFLVEGAPTDQLTVEQKGKTIRLIGLLGVLNFDLAYQEISPDLLFVSMRKADIRIPYSEYTKFRFSHDLSTGETFENIAERPNMRIRVTDFANLDDPDTETAIITEANEIVPIKAATQGVTILGGEGSIVFDNDYLADKWSENGIGNPATVMAEFWRYCTPNDRASFYVRSIDFLVERWVTTLETLSGADARAIMDGKTLFFRTGNAAGKIYKIKQYGAGVNAYTTQSFGRFSSVIQQTFTVPSGYVQKAWDNVSNLLDGGYVRNTPDNDDPLASTVASVTGLVSQNTGLPNSLESVVSQALLFRKFETAGNAGRYTFDDFPDDTEIVGIEWVETHYNTANILNDWDALFYWNQTTREVVADYTVKILPYGKNYLDTHSSTEHAKRGAWTSTTPVTASNRYWQQVTYGGPLDTWGLEEALVGGRTKITVADLKQWINGATGAPVDSRFTVMRAVSIATARYGQTAATARIGSAFLRVYLRELGRIHIVDINGYTVHPEEEGIAVGDQVDVGDYNSVEDALRKVLLFNQFQSVDSTKPFYMDIEPCAPELAPSVSPLRPKRGEDLRWLQIAEDILEFAPPDYRLYTDVDGVIRARKLNILNNTPEHRIHAFVDLNADRSGFGVVTRLAIEAQSGSSVNVAQGILAGGRAVAHCYHLDNFALSNNTVGDYDKPNYGVSLSQAAANAIINQVFDGNMKSPLPEGDKFQYGDPEINRSYGVIWQQGGKNKYVKRHAFAYTDLFALDIGRTEDGNPIGIEAFQITHLNHFIDEYGKVKPSMLVYYMTEEDYISENGAAPPADPNSDDTSYFPDKNSSSWRLLADEFLLQEGGTTIEAEQFEGGTPVKVRFLKFQSGQCQFRMADKDKNVFARICISDIRVYSSRTISSTAELGVTPAFSEPEYKELASRLRRRTEWLPTNPLLDSYARQKDFLAQQLYERLVDYTPLVVTAFAPHVVAGEWVVFEHPESYSEAWNEDTALLRGEKPYLVVANKRDYNGMNALHLLNYDLILDM